MNISSKPVLEGGALPSKVADAYRSLVDGWEPLSKKVLDVVLPLPGPRELGKSTHNALPMRFLTDNEPDAYTWEDWEEEMRRDHPIAWFLRREAPRPFRRAWKRADDAVYWLKCHTLPSYRFHILDLRNPGGGIEWDYGWRDRTEVLLWTCFKMLVDFVEKEVPGNMEVHCAGMTEEEVQATYGNQLHMYRETMALYHWWKTGRAEEIRLNEELMTSIEKAPNVAEKKRRRQAWHDAEDASDARDQKNLERLIAIRSYLWT
jgi:hypothetical protein